MDKFIILSPGRSGSTLLATALNCHPDIQCLDEMLMYSDSSWWNPSVLASGFKVINTHVSPICAQKSASDLLCHREELRVIYIRRQNEIERALSVITAKYMDRWHRRQGDNFSIYCPEIKPEEVLNEILLTRHHEREARNLFRECLWLETTYETLIRDWPGVVGGIQYFLGVSVQGVPKHEEKFINRDWSEILPNYYEINQEVQLALGFK